MQSQSTSRGSAYIMSDTPRVVIAMGDPAGISPEFLAKLLSQ